MTFRHKWKRLLERHRLALVVAGYVVLTAAFAALVPPFESPDETGHLFYVNFVARRLELPNQYDPDRSVAGEGHQFPLYYLMAGAIVRLGLDDNSVDLDPRPNRNDSAPTAPGARPKFIHVGQSIFDERSDAAMFYVLRAFSLVLGASTVVATWHVGGELGLTPGARMFSTIFVATLPQFLFITASINNDNLANLLITLAILFMLRLDRAPDVRNAVGFGLMLGLALATKKSALFLVPVFLIVALRRLRIPGPERRQLLNPIALASALAALICGWIFMRQRLLYGDPLGTTMERRTMPALVDPKSLLDPYWIELFVPRLSRSFIGVFGWMDVPMPAAIHLVYFALGVLGVVGLAMSLPRLRGERSVQIGILLVLGCLAGVVIYNLTYTQYQGRFLFPVIAVLAALFTRGLAEVVARSRLDRWQGRIAILSICFFLVSDVVALVVIYDFYGSGSAYI